MGIDATNYSEREHTYIKHLFLSEYLEIFAYKVTQGRNVSRLNFVDAFAGPWNVNDVDNYSDTSFALSMGILERVKNALNKRGRNLDISYLFCEKDHSRFSDLKKFCEAKDTLNVKVFHGDFERHTSEISQLCNLPNSFTFTFIDPTGWDLKTNQIVKFINETNSEFMINYMSTHVKRFPDFEYVAASYGNLLGNEKWRARFDQLRSQELSNEVAILAILKERLIEMGAAKYIPDFPIKKSRKDELQMRLLLGTKNQFAVELFRATQKKIELKEFAIRDDIASNDKELRLFSSELMSLTDQKSFGFGCSKQMDCAKKIARDFLSEKNECMFEELAVHIQVNAHVSYPDIKEIVIDLKRRSELDYQLPSNKKKPDRGVRLFVKQVQKELF